MSEEIKIDEEFQHKALFDLEFEKSQKKSAEFNQSNADFAEKQVQLHAEREKESQKALNDLRSKTSSFFGIQTMLEHLEKYNPTLKAQAEACLFDIINKDPIDRHYSSRNKKKSGKETIDLDGSKKTLWGKLKNKAKNFWYPNNHKKTMESYIADFKKDMEAHPETYEWLKRCARPEGKSYDSKEKISFSQLYEQSEKMAKYYNNERVDRMIDKDRNAKYAEESKANVQNREATIDAIHQVRDKAAKEIELRAMARETTGIKDAQANTGIDRLEDKAKMMEGMTPQQRLAFRMSQLRGTSKETPAAPATPRTVDSNVMNKALESKMRA